MGNTVTKETYVSLKDLADLQNLKYRVIRTSGVKEDGWVISKSLQAMNSEKGWRLFMHNNDANTDKMVFGWRRVDTIEPFELDGDEEAINKWRESVIDRLNKLDKQATRVKTA